MIDRVWKRSPEDKGAYVNDLFTALAGRYDRMTDAWTFGLHRRWKRRAVELVRYRPGERVLDVATGTGDLARMAAQGVGSTGAVLGVDFCQAMLDVAERRVPASVQLRRGDATALELEDGAFDLVTIGFGLRNVGRQGQALREFHRVLRPGGRLMILDFAAPPSRLLAAVHATFFYGLMPALGRLVALHGSAPHYTADSMRTWASPERLGQMMEEAGFRDVWWARLDGGFAAVHLGYRPA